MTINRPNGGGGRVRGVGTYSHTDPTWPEYAQTAEMTYQVLSESPHQNPNALVVFEGKMDVPISKKSAPGVQP